MPTLLTVYRCLLISPGDVSSERDAVEACVTRWNAHVGSSQNVRVEVVRWESHSRPELADEHPQTLLNRQIVDTCDFGIAIFWSRLGTPTVSHASGSVEEIERLLAGAKKVLIYFSSKAVPQGALEDDQFAQLQSARQRFLSRGLLGTFDSPGHLAEQVGMHLSSLLGSAAKQDAGHPARAVERPLDVRVEVSGVSYPEVGLHLCARIENHSDRDIYIIGFSAQRPNGAELILDGDRDWSLGHIHLQAGNSFTLHIAEEELRRKVRLNGKGWGIVVRDALGRLFVSEPGSLEAAVEKLDRKRAFQAARDKKVR